MQETRTKSISKSAQTDTTDEIVVEADRSKTDEVLEECDSCLADIDAILDEHETRELTDEEIVAKGYPEPEWLEGWNEDKFNNSYWSEDKTYYNEMTAAWKDLKNQFKTAYQNLTGEEYEERCVC